MNKRIELKYLIIAILASLVVGFLIGEEYSTSRLARVISKSSVSTIKSKKEDTTKMVDVSIGDEINLASVKIIVKSFEEVQNIQPGWGEPIFPSEGGKFVKIDVSVTNTTNSEFTLGSNWALLVNEDGKEFSEHDNSYELDDYIGYETLKPDIPVLGSFIFEVSESSDDLSLVLSKAGTSEKYRVKLN